MGKTNAELIREKVDELQAVISASGFTELRDAFTPAIIHGLDEALTSFIHNDKANIRRNAKPRENTMTTFKPSFIKDEHLRFLDVLRDDGKINMVGASEPLREIYDELSRSEAEQVLRFWMDTYTGEER